MKPNSPTAVVVAGEDEREGHGKEQWTLFGSRGLLKIHFDVGAALGRR